MSDFTKLELAVLDAIADETTEQAPELPGQIADARVVDRTRNGAGFITHIQVDPTRTAPIESAPRQLGTIHADIAGLADPVGFRAVIQHGLLTALETETYGQDTSAIDFTTAPFGGLFRLTPEGESVAVTSPTPVVPTPSPLHPIQQRAGPLPTSDPPPVNLQDLFALKGGQRPSPERAGGLQSARLPFPLFILFMVIDFAVVGGFIIFFLGLHEQVPALAAVLSGLSTEVAIAGLVAVMLCVTLLRWLFQRRAKAHADG
ncbi:hypothetical protein [Brevundimonas sp.]|uniref:hypothetical protein n=1 Tax=Brevundimonas sp. TaxID=1871086 RepID=UPI001D24B03C|nr:hypothetical protein [Brevundimonas sp.]MBA4001047.1 hypothetical protein [Brevundimonas sp.]